MSKIIVPQVIVRGGGDIATATIMRLHRVGFSVLVLETEKPTAIRRTVAFSEAVFTGSVTIEGVTARRVQNITACSKTWTAGEIPILIDPSMDCLEGLDSVIMVDAILAKKGRAYTSFPQISYSIGLGPGFIAPEGVNAVIETARGHNLGRIYYSGQALANTGIPGEIAGKAKERVVYSPNAGKLQLLKQIGDVVDEGETIAFIETSPVSAPFSGLLRGILPDGFMVKKGLKLGDIDPRKEEVANCYLVSDKARCISGSVLEAILMFQQRQK